MILLQVNFDFPAEMMGDALVQNAKELAESINNEPGFISKIWIENPETNESGGIYIFQDLGSAEKYVEMHTKRLQSMGVNNISCKYFTVNKTLSKINKGI